MNRDRRYLVGMDPSKGLIGLDWNWNWIELRAVKRPLKGPWGCF